MKQLLVQIVNGSKVETVFCGPLGQAGSVAWVKDPAASERMKKAWKTRKAREEKTKK